MRRSSRLNRFFRRGIVQVNVEPVVHLEHQVPEPRVGARQLLQPAIGQHDHVVLRQIVRVLLGLRQDLVGGDVLRDDSTAG